MHQFNGQTRTTTMNTVYDKQKTPVFRILLYTIGTLRGGENLLLELRCWAIAASQQISMGKSLIIDAMSQTTSMQK